jgi:DNA polymerase-4
VGNTAEELLRLARGKDDRPVEPDRQCKSLSSEQTFATDIGDETILLSVLLEQVEEVAQRLRHRQLKAKTITLKLRYGDFRTMTRSGTLSEPTNLTKPLWETAERTFRRWQSRSAGPLRLLGFGVSGLEPEHAGQQSLFADPDRERRTRLDQAMDRIRDRYGKRAVHRGTSTDPRNPKS